MAEWERMTAVEEKRRGCSHGKAFLSAQVCRVAGRSGAGAPQSTVHTIPSRRTGDGRGCTNAIGGACDGLKMRLGMEINTPS